MKLYSQCPNCSNSREKANAKCLLIVWDTYIQSWKIRCYHDPGCIYYNWVYFESLDFLGVEAENIRTENRGVDNFITPIPENVILKKENFENSFLYSYRTRDNEVLFYKARTRDKRFFYIAYTETGWVLQRPPILTLYHAQYLDKVKKVIVVEGEKTAVAATKLLYPEYLAVTGPLGMNLNGGDWDLLGDKEVYIWPDADLTGQLTAERLKHKYRSWKLINVSDLPNKWDIADNYPNKKEFVLGRINDA